jgi:3-methyl-2-oxobutanoate hydroxymethyltransferase
MNQPVKRVRVRHFAQAKTDGVKIVGLTSYDYLTAGIFDRAGVDFLLVGDSAGNVVLGHDTTVPTTVDELIPLTRGVVKAVSRALVVADLPFGSYESGTDDALHTAVRFMKETGAHAVKLEGGVRSVAQIERLVQSGIPVMGHVGFTPQSEHGLGGHVVQGRGERRQTLIDDALAVEAAGAFAVVLEMVPEEVATEVTSMLSIPTIGIGAGRYTDGQILVWTDLLGLNTGRLPRFVSTYLSLADDMTRAVESWRDDVRSGDFPTEDNVFSDD